MFSAKNLYMLLHHAHQGLLSIHLSEEYPRHRVLRRPQHYSQAVLTILFRLMIS